MRTLDSITHLEAETGERTPERIEAGKPFTIYLWAHGRERYGTGLPAGEGPEVAHHALLYADDPEEAAAALRNLARTALDAAEKIENAERQKRGLKPLSRSRADAKRREAVLPHLSS